jgi:hypothetical protein
LTGDLVEPALWKRSKPYIEYLSGAVKFFDRQLVEQLRPAAQHVPAVPTWSAGQCAAHAVENDLNQAVANA